MAPIFLRTQRCANGLTRLGHDHLPRVIARAAEVGERHFRARDDALQAHESYALTPFAGRVLRHSATRFLAKLKRNIARRNARTSEPSSACEGPPSSTLYAGNNSAGRFSGPRCQTVPKARRVCRNRSPAQATTCFLTRAGAGTSCVLPHDRTIARHLSQTPFLSASRTDVLRYVPPGPFGSSFWLRNFYRVSVERRLRLTGGRDQ